MPTIQPRERRFALRIPTFFALFVLLGFLALASCRGKKCGPECTSKSCTKNDTCATKCCDKDSATSSATSPTAPTIANNAFACPMHPQITGKKGDKCSKCGMELQPVSKK